MRAAGLAVLMTKKLLAFLVEARDASGNTTRAGVTVSVPLSR